MCVLCPCKAFKMSILVLTFADFFFRPFLLLQSHSRKSSVCYVFLRQSCGGSSSPVRLATVRGSTRYACFVLTPPSLPKGPNPCRSLQRLRIAALSRQKSLFLTTKTTDCSTKFRRLTSSAKTSCGVHWKVLFRRGAVVLILAQRNILFSQKTWTCWVMTWSEEPFPGRCPLSGCQIYLPSFTCHHFWTGFSFCSALGLKFDSCFFFYYW